jgi:hypothetical protein
MVEGDNKPKKNAGNSVVKSNSEKRAAESSEDSPPRQKLSKNKKRNEKLEDKNKEIEILKDEIQSKKQIMEKIKNLSKEDLEKVGIHMEELDSDQEEDDSMNLDDENEAKDSEEVASLKEQYLKYEMGLEEVTQKLQEKGCYESFKKQLGYIDMDKSDEIDFQENINKLNKKISIPTKVQYKFIVKLRLNDIHFTDPTSVTRQIKEIKGKVNIENAFFNRFNNLLYLCTNDEESFKHLNSPWPENAFKKGVEICNDSPREMKYFVAINGIDPQVETENDPDFIAICKAKGIFRLQRLIQKQEGKPLSTIKGYVNDKDSYEHLIKNGLKYDFFSFKVTPWKFDKFQPVQCYKCLKFGHNQRFCRADCQKCLCCSGDHSFKDFPTKENLKCINCNGAHAACSKECPANIKAANKKKQMIIAKATSQVTSLRPYNSMFRNESGQHSTNYAPQSNSKNFNNDNQLNKMLSQLIQLLSHMLTSNHMQQSNIYRQNATNPTSQQNNE